MFVIVMDPRLASLRLEQLVNDVTFMEVITAVQNVCFLMQAAAPSGTFHRRV
jgi:hypothetical protein